jgi:hypothetical protein
MSSSVDVAAKVAEFDVLLRKLERELAAVNARRLQAESESTAWRSLQLEVQAQCSGLTQLRVDVGCGVYAQVRVHADTSPLLLDYGLGWLVEFESPRAALPVIEQLVRDADAEVRLVADRHQLVAKHTKSMRFALKLLKEQQQPA